ncbi:hypothetical protein PPL_11052 [Heterostelium album PN500]|uniref:Ankyrin repeat protein n=1 Tax=Heterostelium pallidum (strain ATCC 26659 / Pp 5 / PN500) TaxID=670386 RepID=D3BST2_HETP5|nr:hypothetical protein PPL_11052 [Heterostelium album PN500]EFA75547.1 hypothetical protein PPL_11052 [Heterostelium album PN500]|eukprot:XP_020427681.1 hypothetical protein PPL_11052 [Heterostelium album PN500]
MYVYVNYFETKNYLFIDNYGGRCCSMAMRSLSNISSILSSVLLSVMILSINQISLIMDNSIFKLVFNNILLRNFIFQQVRSIHVDCLREKSYKWHEVECKPYLLAGYNYFQLLKEYYKGVAGKNKKWYRFLVSSSIDTDLVIGKTLRIAVIQDRLEIVKYFMEHYKLYEEVGRLMGNAVCYGKMDILLYLDQLPAKNKDYAVLISNTPLGGNFPMLEWIIKNKLATSSSNDNETRYILLETIKNAALAGRVDMLEFLMARAKLTTLSEAATPYILVSAIKSGSIATVEWLLAHGIEYEEGVNYINLAALHGHLNMVLYFHEWNLGSFSPKTMDFAISSGSLQLVQWLHENRKDGCTHSSMVNAASKNRLDMVRWLHLNRSDSFDNSILNDILKNKPQVSVGILQYMLDNKLYTVIDNHNIAMSIFSKSIGESEQKVNNLKFLLYNRHRLFDKPIELANLLELSIDSAVSKYVIQRYYNTN